MTVHSMSQYELGIRQKLKDNLRHYASKALFIRTKSGRVEPFIFNRAQDYIHEKLEHQKATTGKVRALILKGRQQGCSTYVGGRFYHRTTHSFGLKTFILTHEDQATSNLFEMVNRFHENCPDLIKPITGAANAKELSFSALDSGYKVGTAGTKGAGRSSTVQLFHGSEVAFWPNADSHAAGILQAVPDEPGTEVILESTANGIGNFFHERWQEAERGEGEFIAIFVPWFWQEEYRKPVPPDFEMTDEELEYGELWNLDLEQVYWRREKIRELRSSELFDQEYPATSAVAFQTSGHDSFIPPMLLLRARKNTAEASGPLIIGFDPAWMGADRGAMAWRRGRRVLKIETRGQISTMESAGWCRKVIDDEKPAKLFIDVGGVGAGVYDRLIEMGYSKKVVAVNFGSAPEEPATDGGGAVNRRAEMWMRSRDWLEMPAGVQVPDLDAVQKDACGPTYKYDSLTRLQLEKKEDMRKRGVKSPDLWDAVALTFAEHVPPEAEDKPKIKDYRREPVKRGKGWMAR